MPPEPPLLEPPPPSSEGLWQLEQDWVVLSWSLGRAPAELKKGEKRSGKPLSVQPIHRAFAPTHQLVPPFHLRVGQSLRVFGPLQPLSLRQSPCWPKVVAHA